MISRSIPRQLLMVFGVLPFSQDFAENGIAVGHFKLKLCHSSQSVARNHGIRSESRKSDNHRNIISVTE